MKLPFLSRGSAHVTPSYLSEPYLSPHVIAQQPWATGLDPDDLDDARKLVVIEKLRRKRGQKWFVRKSLKISELDSRGYPHATNEPRSLGSFLDVPTPEQLESAFRADYGGGQYQIVAGPDGPVVHTVTLEGSPKDPYYRSRADMIREATEIEAKRAAELEAKEEGRRAERRARERAEKREDDEYEEKRSQRRKELARSPLEQRLEEIAMTNILADPEAMTPAVNAYMAKIMGVPASSFGGKRDNGKAPDPLDDPSVQKFLEERPDLKDRVVAGRIAKALGLRAKDVLGEEEKDAVGRLLDDMKRVKQIRATFKGLEGGEDDEGGSLSRFLRGVTLQGVLDAIPKVMGSLPQPQRLAIDGTYRLEDGAPAGNGRSLPPVAQAPRQLPAAMPVGQAQPAAQPGSGDGDEPVMVWVPRAAPQRQLHPPSTGQSPSAPAPAPSTGAGLVAAPVSLDAPGPVPVQASGQSPSAGQPASADIVFTKPTKRPLPLVTVPGGLLGSEGAEQGEEGMDAPELPAPHIPAPVWDAFALTMPPSAREKSYRPLIQDVSGDGVWVEWPPAPDEPSALSRVKAALPASTDFMGWFIRIDWGGLGEKVAGPPDAFVQWLVGEARQKEEARLLFDVLSSVSPVTFGRVLAGGARNPLIRSTKAGQVCQRLTTREGLVWVTQAMAVAHELSDRLERQMEQQEQGVT